MAELNFGRKYPFWPKKPNIRFRPKYSGFFSHVSVSAKTKNALSVVHYSGVRNIAEIGLGMPFALEIRLGMPLTIPAAAQYFL